MTCQSVRRRALCPYGSQGKCRERCMLTLYDFGNSVCCQKVRITLCEKGLVAGG